MKEIETIITGDEESYFSNPVNKIIIRMEDPDGNLIKKLVFTDDEGIVQKGEVQVCKHGAGRADECNDCIAEEKYVDRRNGDRRNNYNG